MKLGLERLVKAATRSAAEERAATWKPSADRSCTGSAAKSEQNVRKNKMQRFYFTNSITRHVENARCYSTETTQKTVTSSNQPQVRQANEKNHTGFSKPHVALE